MKERTHKLKREVLFGVGVDPLTLQETVSLVEQKIRDKKPTHLLGVNADKINSLGIDDKYDDIIKNAEIINADGASLVIASKILKHPLPERVAGIDLMQSLLDASEKKNYSVYFLGSKQEVVEKMLSNFHSDYPKLNVSGYRNGYFTEAEWPTVSGDLKKKQPDIIFIGITSPIKEYLIDYLMRDSVNSIFMGVGGSFDVLSGNINRAPMWYQNHNLEWLYRLLQEPKRLFKRYLFGNIKFILLVLREKMLGGNHD